MTLLKAHDPPDPDTDGVRPSSPACKTPSGDAGHPGGSCVSPLAAAARVVDFVVWEMRLGDLPDDVRAAATVLRDRPRPAHLEGRTVPYEDGPFQVDGFPPDDGELIRTRCYAHQVGEAVRALVDNGCEYVLIDIHERTP